MTRARIPEASISTASMADIAFLLLVFFLTTTVFEVDRTPARLPAARAALELERGAAVLSVARSGSAAAPPLRFSDGSEPSVEVAPAEVPRLVTAALERFRREGRQHLFVIKADEATPYRVVDGLLAELRRAGATNVWLLARPRPEESP